MSMTPAEQRAAERRAARREQRALENAAARARPAGAAATAAAAPATTAGATPAAAATGDAAATAATAATAAARPRRDPERQITALRTKVDLLHQILVAMRQDRGCCDIEDIAAPLMPLERRLAAAADNTIFCFSAMAIGAPLPRRQFLTSLMARPSNLYFVKDFRECWYQRGLIGLTADVPATARHLARLVPSYSKRTSMIGASAGGFAAILFGVLNNVDRIIAFGPQTIVDRATFDQYATAESQWEDVTANGDAYLDLKKVIRNSTFSGEIEIHIAESFDFDRAAAERLADLPNVRLVRHAIEGHAVASALKRSGELDRILATLWS